LTLAVAENVIRTLIRSGIDDLATVVLSGGSRQGPKPRHLLRPPAHELSLPLRNTISEPWIQGKS
jgi:hypothetical protein